MEGFSENLYPTVSYNMTSIVRGGPHPHRDQQPASAPQGAAIVIDWLQNILTYQDGSKAMTIPMIAYRYNAGGISIALPNVI